MRRIVWTAVIAAVLGVLGIVLAVAGREESIPVGMAAIVAAILSNRDVR